MCSLLLASSAFPKSFEFNTQPKHRSRCGLKTTIRPFQRNMLVVIIIVIVVFHAKCRCLGKTFFRLRFSLSLFTTSSFRQLPRSRSWFGAKASRLLAAKSRSTPAWPSGLAPAPRRRDINSIGGSKEFSPKLFVCASSRLIVGRASLSIDVHARSRTWTPIFAPLPALPLAPSLVGGSDFIWTRVFERLHERRRLVSARIQLLA